MKASVITAVVVAHDAISISTMDKVHALQGIAREQGEPLELAVYCHHADVAAPGLKLATSVADVVLDRHFLESDLLLYEFGIYYGLFDSIHLAQPRARKLVHFHNVTPPELVHPGLREKVERSLVQLLNIGRADMVLTPSEFNARTLREQGFSGVPILPLNLVVEPGSLPPAPPRKLVAGQPLELVYVGRFVRSKSVTDAIRAVRQALDHGAGPIHLTLIGSETFSDAAYLQEMRELIHQLRLKGSVQIATNLTNEQRDLAYSKAHALVMPSLHEGFCAPVIEAQLQGCFTIASDAGNLPYVVEGLGRIVPAEDVGAFASAIQTFDREMRAGGASITTDRGQMSAEELHRQARARALGYSRSALKEQLREALAQAGVLPSRRQEN